MKPYGVKFGAAAEELRKTPTGVATASTPWPSVPNEAAVSAQGFRQRVTRGFEVQAGQGFEHTNPDAVQEVHVQTSHFDSKFGHPGSAVIHAVTESGINQYEVVVSYNASYDDAVTNLQSLLKIRF